MNAVNNYDWGALPIVKDAPSTALASTHNVVTATDINLLIQAILDVRKVAEELPPVFNVRRFGALGNGTDDTAAIDRAQVACNTAGGGVVYFPAGVYGVGGGGLSVKASSGSTYRGAGMRLTTLLSLPSLTSWQWYGGNPALQRSGITFENLTLDCNGSGTGGILASSLYGASCQGWKILNVRVFISNKLGVMFQGTPDSAVDYCEFYGFGGANVSPVSAGTGITANFGVRNLKVHNTRFKYHYLGVQVTGSVDPWLTAGDADTNLNSNLSFVGNDFDQGWMYWPAHKTGSATYTGSVKGVGETLFPSGALTAGSDFSNADLLDQTAKVPNANNHIRILLPVDSGTFDVLNGVTGRWASAGAMLSEKADFSKVVAGDIVRTASKYAVVDGVAGNLLSLEEWLDASTHALASPPVIGDTFQVFHLLMGRTALGGGISGPTLTTYDGFYDLTGIPVVVDNAGNWTAHGVDLGPSKGSTFELFRHPIYNLHCDYNTRDILVHGNRFYRGWGDACSLYGDGVTVTANDVYHTQDVGITVNGTPGRGATVVADNRIRRAGSCAIFLGHITSFVCRGNVATDCTWVNHSNRKSLGHILVEGASKGIITGNMLDGGDREQAVCGIGVKSDKYPGIETFNSDLSIFGNLIRGMNVTDVAVYGSGSTLIRIDQPGARLVYGATSQGTATP